MICTQVQVPKTAHTGVMDRATTIKEYVARRIPTLSSIFLFFFAMSLHGRFLNNGARSDVGSS